MQLVQKILRHANIRLTIDTYGHLDVEDMREAIELMPAAPAPRDPEPPAAALYSQMPSQKTGRNDPCPCGSGKKYKKCHGVVQ